jgi:hypothetical protein
MGGTRWHYDENDPRGCMPHESAFRLFAIQPAEAPFVCKLVRRRMESFHVVTSHGLPGIHAGHVHLPLAYLAANLEAWKRPDVKVLPEELGQGASPQSD